MPLNTSAHMAGYDDLYEALIAAHHGLSLDDSHAMNARLVLLLANHIGDLEVLREALQAARGAGHAEATVMAATPGERTG
jgi:predicted LPLAT superfamily acyltransferase